MALDLAPLALGVLLAQVSPGPNMMAVSAAALGGGRAHGVATAAGVAAGVFLWAILFSLGAGALLDTYPQLVIAMKLIGGGYLLYLGVKAVRGAFRSGAPTAGAHAARHAGLASAFRTGLLVVMTNPKAALMWVAIALYIAATPALAGPLGTLAVGLAASASAMLIYGGYGVLFSTGFAASAYARAFRVIDGAFGAVFGALGGRLVLDGVRDLR